MAPRCVPRSSARRCRRPSRRRCAKRTFVWPVTRASNPSRTRPKRASSHSARRPSFTRRSSWAIHAALVLGEGRMLPKFETGLNGIGPGESRTFQVSFPADYGAKEVAGKRATFEVTVKKVEQPKLPELDAEFARSLGVEDGDLAKMRAEVKANVEREVKKRID